MYTAMIVEDEMNILKYMNKMVSSIDEFAVKAAYASPEEALRAFGDIMPDVVFLDIEMPRMNGIELARKMLLEKEDLNIVFTTAYGNYAVNAFEVEAIDYLMKPIIKEDLERVLKRLNKAARPAEARSNPLTAQNPPLPVSCFGCFEVRDGKQNLVKWPTKKAEEAFSYFVVYQGKYISKWELLETFWADLEDERRLPNLYNTIYRIKKVLKFLPLAPQIQSINEGYMLKAEGCLSDLGQFLEQEKQPGDSFSEEAASGLFFSYSLPVFGTRDYLWSLPVQQNAAKVYHRLCCRLLRHYYEQNQLKKAEEIIRHYVTLHIEDEDIMREWLGLVSGWKGCEGKTEEYRRWFNEKLKAAELPLLK